ncbi:hypothetical protein O3P69_002611 [Scylla paramamosain]|uniref:Integrase zinc-binding domain-containing protein n=1 Tax=Scylla paramamosain TaxID=85552 RepID=A0AAW0UN89_SCYPA
MRGMLVHAIGIAEDDNSTMVDDILDCIHPHFQRQRNVTLHHVRFEERHQGDGESFDDSYVILKELADDTKFYDSCLNSRFGDPYHLRTRKPVAIQETVGNRFSSNAPRRFYGCDALICQSSTSKSSALHTLSHRHAQQCGNVGVEDVDNCAKIVDMLVWDNAFEEHLQRIRRILERFRQYRLSIYRNQFIFASLHLSFCGFSVSRDGTQADPAQIWRKSWSWSLRITFVRTCDVVACSDPYADPVIADILKALGGSDTYLLLLTYVSTGFLMDKQDVPPSLRDYWKIHDNLSGKDGLVLYGPRSIEGAKRQVHLVVWWPAINSDIAICVKKCKACQEMVPSQQKESLFSDPPPSRLFEDVSADLFSHSGKDYLIYADSLSG